MSIDNELLKEIEALIRENKLIVFCGAGISCAPPSSLPLANELKRNMVGRLIGFERTQTLADKLDKIPLELIIEIIDGNSEKFMPALGKLFHAPRPNRNHVFLAQLMAKDHIQAIMTTNFDTLLEKAISDFSKLSFRVYSTEDAFSSMKLGDLFQSSIIKIHGTADNIASIRSTVQQIAIPGKSQTRKNAISLFFQSGKSILILGYGARDEFDINPCLRSLTSLSKIYFIKHRSDDVFEVHPLGDPFSNFDGVTISCNTDCLITELRKRLFSETDSAQTPVIPTWGDFLNEWDSEIDSPIRLVLGAEILENIDEPQIARQFYLESLEKWPDDVNRMKTLINLGNDEERMGLFPEAEQHFKAAFEFAQNLGTETAKAAIFQHLGQLAYQRRDYPAAMVLTRQSEGIFERQYQQARKGISVVEHQLGMIFSGMGLNPKAEEQLRRSLQTSIELGDLEGQATSLAQLGRLYRDQRKLDPALNAFGEARSILVKLGKTDIVNRIDGDIAQAKRETKTP